MITTFQALAVALIAITPGATYTFAYERHAGAYGAHLSDRLVRFLVASGFFHAILVVPELAIFKRIEREGYGWVIWWQAELAVVLYFVLPFAVGSLFGWAIQRNHSWVRWIVGSSRHPRAWDHLWSHDKALIVRTKLTTGDHLAGIYEPSSGGIGSYASGYGEDGDLYLSRQLKVDPVSGEFEVDEDGSPVPYDPPTGLLLRAADVESWHIQEVAQ